MKRILLIMMMAVLASACAPEIGSKEWCDDMREKPKGDWTMNEAGSFAEHCVFSDGKDE